MHNRGRLAAPADLEVDEDSGTRDYYLRGEQAGPDAFDAILDQIASDWLEHLSRY